jgi:hypothetical protein
VSIDALLVLYPLAPLNCSSWVDAVAVGAGPTLYRGGTAEFAKQWNIRLLYELPFAPGILLSGGVSWRAIDTPVSAEIGSIVAVARPGGAPPFETEQRTAVLGSLGVGIDLALIANLATSAANTLTGKNSAQPGAAQ